MKGILKICCHGYSLVYEICIICFSRNVVTFSFRIESLTVHPLPDFLSALIFLFLPCLRYTYFTAQKQCLVSFSCVSAFNYYSHGNTLVRKYFVYSILSTNILRYIENEDRVKDTVNVMHET